MKSFALCNLVLCVSLPCLNCNQNEQKQFYNDWKQNLSYLEAQKVSLVKNHSDSVNREKSQRNSKSTPEFLKNQKIALSTKNGNLETCTLAWNKWIRNEINESDCISMNRGNPQEVSAILNAYQLDLLWQKIQETRMISVVVFKFNHGETWDPRKVPPNTTFSLLFKAPKLVSKELKALMRLKKETATRILINPSDVFKIPAICREAKELTKLPQHIFLAKKGNATFENECFVSEPTIINLVYTWAPKHDLFTSLSFLKQALSYPILHKNVQAKEAILYAVNELQNLDQNAFYFVHGCSSLNPKTAICTKTATLQIYLFWDILFPGHEVNHEFFKYPLEYGFRIFLKKFLKSEAMKKYKAMFTTNYIKFVLFAAQKLNGTCLDCLRNVLNGVIHCVVLNQVQCGGEVWMEISNEVNKYWVNLYYATIKVRQNEKYRKMNHICKQLDFSFVSLDLK